MIVTLASASPRRRELIKKIPWLEVKIVPSGADENVFASDPKEFVEKLALKKAQCVFDRCGGTVIGADTVVVAGGRILGKPVSAEEARAFFKLLCGIEHSVITGIAIVSKGKTVTASEITKVEFLPYDDAIVEKYIASGAPFDKAGGYGIQDDGIKPIVRKITGDMDNVIGLPVKLLKETLEVFF